MSRVPWSEIAPQIGASVLRVDGRVCLLESRRQENYADKKKKITLPIPRLIFKMKCGETVDAQEVSLNTYYPAQIPDAPTCTACVACITAKESQNGETRKGP